MKTLSIVCKEIKNNLSYLVFFIIGLAFLLSVICVLITYSQQSSEGLLSKYKDADYISLSLDKLSNHEVCEYATIFGRKNGTTYNVTASHDNTAISLPSYEGGICVISTCDTLPILNTVDMTASATTENGIWLHSRLANMLNCSKDSSINIADKTYYVSGIFDNDNIPEYIGKIVSFIIYDPITIADELQVVVPSIKNLLTISDYLNQDNYTDSEGILALCKGYQSFVIGTKAIIAGVGILVVLYIYISIQMYLNRRKEFIGLLNRSGISKLGLNRYLSLLFGIACICTSLLSVIFSIVINQIVSHWANDILNVSSVAINYPLFLIIGFISSSLIALMSILIKLKRLAGICEVKNT